jgi:NAD-dependent deacetylase
LLRPDVVLFGEPLKESTVERFYGELCAEPPDLLLVIGTTAEFSYIVDPVKLARDAGKLTVEVNPEPTVLSDIVDYSLRASASRVVPALAGAIKARFEQTRRSPD